MYLCIFMLRTLKKIQPGTCVAVKECSFLVFTWFFCVIMEDVLQRGSDGRAGGLWREGRFFYGHGFSMLFKRIILTESL